MNSFEGSIAKLVRNNDISLVVVTARCDIRSFFSKLDPWNLESSPNRHEVKRPTNIDFDFCPFEIDYNGRLCQKPKFLQTQRETDVLKRATAHFSGGNWPKSWLKRNLFKDILENVWVLTNVLAKYRPIGSLKRKQGSAVELLEKKKKFIFFFRSSTCLKKSS